MIAFASKVQYSVKNTFIDVTVAEKKPFRASSAPPAARFAQVPESPAASHSDKHADDQVQRMSRTTISQIQELTKKLKLKSSRWIRVVHSGYGAAKWDEALRRSAVVWVAASKAAEGVYVYMPANIGTDGTCQALKQLNTAVRRDTYFRNMKRSNKSRLQFKEEILVTAGGLVQEDASTSAGSEAGSPGSSSDLDAAEHYLAALNSELHGSAPDMPRAFVPCNQQPQAQLPAAAAQAYALVPCYQQPQAQLPAAAAQALRSHVLLLASAMQAKPHVSFAAPRTHALAASVHHLLAQCGEPWTHGH
jgi:hypothetical protein